MKTIIQRLSIISPILYILCRWIWNLFEFSIFPPLIQSLLYDFCGPVFLMTSVILLCLYTLWKRPHLSKAIQFLFGTNSYLEGTWEGKIFYENNGKKKSKNALLTINQPNGYSINLWLLTDERKSSSKFAFIVPYKGEEKIVYEYETEDCSENKIKNPLHTGFCSLLVSKNKKQLTGLYYTSRLSMGTLEFSKKNNKVINSYNG